VRLLGSGKAVGGYAGSGVVDRTWTSSVAFWIALGVVALPPSARRRRGRGVERGGRRVRYGQIGRELYLSEDTVKTHARRLFPKLGVRHRAQAVHRFLRGLIT
jgi:hypothetical protein